MSFQGLNQLIGVKLLTPGFLENCGSYSQFLGGANARSPLRTPMRAP